MEIENKRGVLDLESGAALEIERTNPLFNEQGSYSLPFSIKRSPHNDYVLGFPDVYERKERFEDKQAVNVRAGILNENATLELFETTDKVEGTIYLYESSFYNKVQEVKLTTVFDGIERWFMPKKETLTDEERAQYVAHIVDMLDKMITTIPDGKQDFTIFPAVIDGEAEIKSTISAPQIKPSQIMNEVEAVFSNDKPTEYRLKARNKIIQTDDDNSTITIPVGYAVSPFLKLSYVLKKIFEYFGYQLESSLLDTDPQCKRWYVLNNTMDAIMPGYFIESQLVPDCTVNEFLNIIRKGMCADFKIFNSSKTAKIIFFNDVLDSKPDIDLTPYLIKSYEKITHVKPKQVRLTINKSLPFSESATETLSEFKKKYPGYNPKEMPILSQGVFPFYSQNSIWKVYDPLPGWLYNEYKTDRLSSLNFDYDTNDDIAREENKIPMEALATAHFTNDGVSYYHAPVIGTIRNLNSLIVLDGTKQVEETPNCPVMMSCEVWSLPIRSGYQHYPYASSGFQNSLLLWTENGFFNRFWKRYDELSRTSFAPNTYKARLPAYLLHSFSFERLKIINGQPMFPVALRYKTLDQEYIEVEMDLKSVKIYTGYPESGNDNNNGNENGGEGEETKPDEKYPELDPLIGIWNILPNHENTTPGFEARFQLNEDYSGTIYMKNENKIIDTTFDSLAFATHLLGLALSLHTPSGDIFISMLARVFPENSYTLLWTFEYNVGVMEKQ